MRTSREIYDKIRWDDRFDPTQFTIGYEVHRKDPKEVPYQDFVPGGDIPWHRVLYFRQNETIVWDRRTRIDQLTAKEQSTDEPVSLIREGQFFRPTGVYSFDQSSQQWQTHLTFRNPESESRSANSLRVITWNVLTDPRETEVIRTDLRVDPIVREIINTNADVIALQEVTPFVWKKLLEHPDIRKNYCASMDDSGAGIDGSTTVLLSRIDTVAMGEHCFSSTKRVTALHAKLGERDVYCVTLHLPSDRANNAEVQRTQQLDAIVQALSVQLKRGDLVVVMGDFNWISTDLDALMARYQLTDVWSQHRPLDPGLTYDPTVNTLTRALSRTGRRARFDRVYINSQCVDLQIEQALLFATSSLPNHPHLFPSDHFGLSVGLRIGDSQVRGAVTAPEVDISQPVHTSALVILPPEQYTATVQQIRQSYDKNAVRWMPHITVLYGFVPESDFDNAARIIANVLSSVEPFDVTLDDIGVFDHRVSRTVFFKPNAHSQQALKQLQSVLQTAFPNCIEQSGHSTAGYQPHLSLGQISKEQPDEEGLLNSAKRLRSLRFTVDRVCLISRRGDEPFAVRDQVGLGSRKLASTKVEQVKEPIANWLGDHGETNNVDDVLKHIQDACEFALSSEALSIPGIGLQLVGAARLGTTSDSSDIDTVMVGPSDISSDVFFAGVKEWLSSSGATVRVIDDAFVPIIRAQFPTKKTVDISYVQWAKNIPYAPVQSLSAGDIRQFNEGAVVALGAARDAEILSSIIERVCGKSVFQTLVRVIKVWAKSRGIYANAWGYLGGFSWTVLALWSAMTADAATRLSVTALLKHFFSVCSQWDGKSLNVCVTAVGEGYQRRSNEVCVITTPSVPVRNSARNVNRATWEVLHKELVRANTILQSGALDEQKFQSLVQPWRAQPEEHTLVTIELSSEFPDDLAMAEGVIVGRVMQLLHALAKIDGVKFRPDPRPIRPTRAHGVVYVIAIDRYGDRIAIENSIKEFENTLQPLLERFRVKLGLSVAFK